MPKNALFLLKNRKNRRALGAPPPNPHNSPPRQIHGYAPELIIVYLFKNTNMGRHMEAYTMS